MKQARVHVSELATMINQLEAYADAIKDDILIVDGEVYLNPTQELAIRQILESDAKKEAKDGQ